MEFKARASSFYKLMTEPKTKADKDAGNLSETAKSYVEEQAYADFFGIRKVLDTKEIKKGLWCEQDGIDLINLVEFTDYTKNLVRRDIGWLSGTCDINATNRIIDVKIPWSFDTFPMLSKDMVKYVKAGGYEWQLRCYMLLYGLDESQVVACLVDTPDELLTEYDNEYLHKVSHIQPNKRLTYSGVFERDAEIETRMKLAYDRANEYYKSVINELKSK